MKLQGELRRQARKCLHRTCFSRGEFFASRGQIAIIAMPMQHRRRGERRERRCFAGIAQCQRRKTDFLHRSRRDARSKGRRHHLCAEANAEHRLIGLKPGLDGSDLAGDKRIGFGLVNADRPAQHDDEIGCDERAGDRMTRRPPRENGCRNRGRRATRRGVQDLQKRRGARRCKFVPSSPRRGQFTRQRIGPLGDRSGAKTDDVIARLRHAGNQRSQSFRALHATTRR